MQICYMYIRPTGYAHGPTATQSYVAIALADHFKVGMRLARYIHNYVHRAGLGWRPFLHVHT